MTDYTKLVKELRGCKYIDYCKDCPRMAANGYVEICNIKDDAADAIEALQAEEKSRKENCEKCSDATRRVIIDLQGIIADLRAQLPKHGEWKRDEKRWGENSIRCSLCGAVIEDEEWGWRNWNYCYHCGAKMEVQE